MARNLTTDVPWNLCHDVSQCGDLNGGQDKVICTINGFWMESGGSDGQPGPEFFEALWSKNPNQPAMWTEDQGWFDQWEYGNVDVGFNQFLTHLSTLLTLTSPPPAARVICPTECPILIGC